MPGGLAFPSPGIFWGLVHLLLVAVGSLSTEPFQEAVLRVNTVPLKGTFVSLFEELYNLCILFFKSAI